MANIDDNDKPIKLDDKDAAVALIRHKLDDLYDHEPTAKKELEEVIQHPTHMSKHQKFMFELQKSGKSIAEIQTAWHNYYTNLPDEEKHDVWQEFYANNTPHGSMQFATSATATQGEPAHEQHPADKPTSGHIKSEPRTEAEVKKQLLSKVQKRQKLSAKHHAKSLAFGLSMGFLVVLILMFSFFNERFIAPLITPSRNVSAAPIVIDPSTTAVDKDPKVIIPKLNVEAPVVYDEPSIADSAVQAALERGVLHYATTPNPGENGNGVIFGHSSSNILNRGKYKFAFALLRQLDNGDIFFLNKDGKRYVYKVYIKEVVKPTQVSVVGPRDKQATFTLITCDPPGTNLNRLVIVGEQISPSPSKNTNSTAKSTSTNADVLPSNSKSLWSRLFN